MAERIHIKSGGAEFEYEGESKFSNEDITNFFALVEKLSKREPSGQQATGASTPPAHDENSAALQDLHMNTIASALDVKNGPDLIVAAAASLELVDRKNNYSRSEIYNRMKEAGNYYNNNMGRNLTKNLKKLIGKKLNQIGNGYALKSDVKKELESKLAAIG